MSPQEILNVGCSISESMYGSGKGKASGFLMASIVCLIIAILYFMLALALGNMTAISLIAGGVVLVLGLAFLGVYITERIRKKQNRFMRT